MASGSGSLAQAIFDHPLAQKCEIVGLISDRDSTALVRAKAAGVPDIYLPMREDRSEWNRELFALVRDLNPDLVVSVGFMRILEPKFVEHFSVLNTHPALLPAFPGAHAVRDAIAARVSETGTTVHWVDAGVDTGPIIAQRVVPVLDGDDEESLHERIKIAERNLIVETLTQWIDGALSK